jgi:hypothetical protein
MSQLLSDFPDFIGRIDSYSGFIDWILSTETAGFAWGAAATHKCHRISPRSPTSAPNTRN